MSGHTIILHGDSQRRFAHELIDKAPKDYVLRITEPKRTNPQNDKMWAMLGEVAAQNPEGRMHREKRRPYTDDEWKCIFLKTLGHDVEMLEDLDGNPFPIAMRSSRMSVRQISDMIEFMYWYGARHGVQWSEPEEKD